jgi:hypothetical protein
MEIERILELGKHVHTDKELLGMIISNRITHFLGDDDGAAISIKNFETLADDILKWHESKAL